MKNTIGIEEDIYLKMVDCYMEFAKRYPSREIKGLMEERFQKVSLRKIALFCKGMELPHKKIGIPKHIVEKLLDEIYFAVNPYMDTVSSKEDLDELKENFPWVAGLCSVYNDLLNNCPDEIKNEFDFIIENE